MRGERLSNQISYVFGFRMMATMLRRSMPWSCRHISCLTTALNRHTQSTENKQLNFNETSFCKSCNHRYISSATSHVTRSDVTACGSYTSRVHTLSGFNTARSIHIAGFSNQTGHGLKKSLYSHASGESQLSSGNRTSIGDRLTRASHAASVGCSIRECHTVPDGYTIPVFLRAEQFLDKIAAMTQHGRYTYDDLLHYSCTLAHDFNEVANRIKNVPKESEFPLEGERIAFLCDNDLSYIVTQWAVWMCGAIAVPLCKSHPISELEYFANDCGAQLLVCSENYRGQLEPISSKLGIPLKTITMDDYSGDYDEDFRHWNTDLGRQLRHKLGALLDKDIYKDRNALIVYTSGTTGRPKVSDTL